MLHWIKSILSLFGIIVGLWCFSLGGGVALAQTQTPPTDPSIAALERYEQQLLTYYENVLKTQGQLNQLQSLTQDSLINLQTQLQATEQNLEESEFRLALAEKFLKLLQKDWLKAQRNYEALQNRMVSRLRWLQKQPRLEGWATLLKSDNLVDFFQKRHRIRLLYQADQQQLKTVQASFAVLQQRRFDIENQKNEIALLQQQLRFQKAQTETQLVHQNALADRLNSDRLALDAALSRLEQDSSSIGQLIRDRRANRTRPIPPVLGGGSGRLRYPVYGPISSEFGWRVHPISGTERLHAGIDFAVDYGTPITAAADGAVIFSGWYGGYGYAVILDHGGGITTLYAHSDELLVSEGSWVTQGTIVAKVGSTGYSTGPHLHFEVRRDGEPVDPRPYF
ncbi:MAG: murein hydrolase activator EnvC family protein [Prochlorotrichaceae cyanobacterium]|jgi:murein DD-endopeptidase MepM/ murein hydrolase activator NlpD